MGNLGIAELALIFFVGLLVLGPKRLPEVARGIGEAFRSFQDAMRGIQRPDERGSLNQQASDTDSPIEENETPKS